MTMEIGKLNNPFNVDSSEGLVSGQELAKVSSELFQVAGQQQSTKVVDSEKVFPQINFNKVQKADQGINLFAANAQTVKQIAVNKSAFDVQLSNSALANIKALNAQAAQAQFSGVAKSVEGKLHIPTEAAQKTEQPQVFALNNAPELFNTANLGKDKKGSTPFAFTAQESKESKETK